MRVVRFTQALYWSVLEILYFNLYILGKIKLYILKVDAVCMKAVVTSNFTKV